MPSSNKFANVGSCVLLSLAILCGLYCLFICGSIFSQSDGEGFAIIDYMVAAEGEVADPTNSPGYYLSWVLGLSLLGAVASILGCVGSFECMDSSARQPFLSTFFCSMLVLSVFFMVVYTSTVEFGDTMVPILTQQMETMTSASVLPIFSSRLNCPVTGPTTLPGQISAATAPPCGADCQTRLALVRTMANRTVNGPDSCAFLVALNRAYVYEFKGAGKCQVTPAPPITAATAAAAATVAATPALPPMYASPAASLDACQDACTSWTACAGVAFNVAASSCLLVSSSDPDGAAGTYVLDATSGTTTQAITPITGVDATTAFECHAKTIPVILQTMIERNSALSYITLIGAVITLVSALLCAMITFTVATKMQGKKGIHMVCLRMYCGCCFTPSDKVRVASKTDGDEEMEPLAGY